MGSKPQTHDQEEGWVLGGTVQSGAEEAKLSFTEQVRPRLQRVECLRSEIMWHQGEPSGNSIWGLTRPFCEITAFQVPVDGGAGGARLLHPWH